MRILFIGAALTLCGCGGETLHPVRGTVRFADGSPLELGRVVVDFGESRTGAWGGIHPDGSFQVGTNTPTDGMLAGTYRVYISGAETLPGPGAPSRPLVHAKFLSPETSGLSFTVPDQPVWDIVVEKPSK